MMSFLVTYKCFECLSDLCWVYILFYYYILNVIRHQNQDQSLTLCILISQDPENAWHKIFFLMAGINVTCLTFYLIFAKGEIQDWAKEIKNTRLWRWDIIRLRSVLKLKTAGKRAADDESLRRSNKMWAGGEHGKSETRSLIPQRPLAWRSGETSELL